MASEQITINGLVVDRYAAEGQPLVMIHGASAGAWCWEQWGPHFAGAGYDVHALNLRGHPPSPAELDLGRLSLADYAADVEGIIENLDRPPVLMGHSMGGAIAQLVAARRDVAALALICPAPLGGVKYQTAGFNIWVALHGVKSIPALIRKKPLKPGRRVLRDAVLNRVEPERREALLQRFVPESAAAGVEILRGSVVADLSRLNVPKLALGGTDDHTSPLEMVREIAAVQGAQCMALEGHAHLPMLEPGWERVADRVVSWLREQGVA
ncbi:alpha/beta fold hydrolase [Ectothiorhodospiraceae bacterium WFHF3C12]|nr:alpha/beta fold hydrolase [Ectothiorhodospiraceae bacterium WFHF3C12]